MRPGNIIAVAIVAAASVGLCTRAIVVLSQDRPVANPTSSTVDIIGFAFPASVTLATGGTVSWVNRDGEAHTVTFTSSPAPEPAHLKLQPGATGTATFAVAGSYEYFCQIHRSMSGSVQVTDPTNSPGSDDYGDH